MMVFGGNSLVTQSRKSYSRIREAMASYLELVLNPRLVLNEAPLVSGPSQWHHRLSEQDACNMLPMEGMQFISILRNSSACGDGFIMQKSYLASVNDSTVFPILSFLGILP